MQTDDLVEVVAKVLDQWIGDTSTSREMALAAIAAARPAIEQEGYQRGVTEAYDAVRGTNADMCKSAVAAYRLCVDATNTLRVNYPPKAAAIRAKGEG